MAEAPIEPRCCCSRTQSPEPFCESVVVQTLRVRKLEPVTFSSRHFTFGVLSSALAATGVAGAVAAAGAAGAALAGVAPDGVALADAEALTGASLPGTGGSAANTGSVINPLAMIIIDFENV